MVPQNEHNKIQAVSELADTVAQLKRQGCKVVHCHGVFDLLHPGHIRHFEEARAEGDVLVVTVTCDAYVNKGPGRPAFNQRLRAESIAALGVVDYVAISDYPTAIELINLLKPDVYVKGAEYAQAANDLTGKIIDETQAIEAVGGRVHFTRDDVVFSSTRLLNEHFPVYPEKARGFLAEFHNRYSADDVIGVLKDMHKQKVLVIGDAIIDEYCYCRVLGHAPKDVYITAQYLREEAFAGGALAAANHVAGFCDDVTLITCLGTQESREQFIRAHLKPNIKPKFFYRDDAPTTVKRRFLEPAFLRKMFEICALVDTPLPESTARELDSYLDSHLGDYDVVIVTDFGHGFLQGDTVNVICNRSRFIALNTQTNSANKGYNLVTKYPRADYVCIDEPEMRLATGDRFSDLQNQMLSVRDQLKCETITVTRGHEGALTFDGVRGFTSVPVFSNQIVDTMGAGDAFLSITSPCVAAAAPMDMVGFIGNAAGALAVKIIGNKASVEPVQLFKFITSLLK